MTAKILDAVDAVVTALNAGTFSQTFTAVDAVLPSFKLDELDSLTVSVVPKSEEATNRDRGSTQRDHGIDVGIIKKLAKFTTDAADKTAMRALLTFVEEIQNALLRVKFGTARCVAVTNEPIYDPAKLREDRLFMSVVTGTFRETS